jgi:peptidoglycan/xylan/chitin deacetylase (PgdA/CDA1 family)
VGGPVSAPSPWAHRGLPGRPGGTWPGGARLAVYVAIGVEHYRADGADGAGETEDLLPGVPAPDLVNRAWRDYGNRVGAFRLLDRLASSGIPPTLLLNSDAYDTAPDLLATARAHGAEVVAHGASNSDTLAGREPDDERAYLSAVADRIAAAEGTRPGGWSSPWLAHTPRTTALLAATGYRYLLDLRLDDQPVWLTTDGGPLLAIPYALELNDSTTGVGRAASGRDFADMVVDEFDELLDASRDVPLVMSVVVHSFISGAPYRLRALARALAHLAAAGDAVWFTQPAAIHAAVTAPGGERLAVPAPPAQEEP